MPVHELVWGPGSADTWTIFGRLPVVVLLALICAGGLRRGWPWRASVLATAALVAGLTAGTAVLPSVVGAIAGGILAWFLAQWMLGVRRAPLQEVALGLLVVLAVGRIGCLLNGCCFGTPTELPWAVHYGPGSAAWALHQALGWIAPHAAHSLAVHPYPLYETVGLALWLPPFFVLRRRLRSEGALLALTAAWDLFLRAWIDGYRGMLNVWWSLLGHDYTIMLVSAGILLVGAAAVLARRSRHLPAWSEQTNNPPLTLGRPDGVLGGWAVWVFVWLLGWGPAVNQTPFLRRLLLGALAASVLALRLPAWVSASTLRQRWLPAVAAAALLLPLAVHLRAFAQPSHDEPAGAGAPEPGTAATTSEAAPTRDEASPDGGRVPDDLGARPPGWQYEVDHQRGTLVRVGSERDTPQDIESRRRALGLTSAEAEKETTPGARARAGRVWLGAGVGGGNTRYQISSGDGCGGNYTVYDRKGLNAWGQAEWEQPIAEEAVAWFGGRAGYVGETTTQEEHSESALVTSRTLRVRTGFAQAWAELEHPNLSAGAGALGFRESIVETSAQGSSSRAVWDGRPGGHLRGGFSFLGVDLGYADRRSMTGFPASHLGLSGTIYDPGAPGQHPDDAWFRYFVGAQTFPGGHAAFQRFAPSVGIEVQLLQRHVIGLDSVWAQDGMAGAAHYRMAIGK